MKFNAGLAKSYWTVVGGFTGAVLFICVSLVLILLIVFDGPTLPYFGIGHTIERWKQEWTNAEIYTALIAAGVIGFSLGAIAGWRYPQKVQNWASLAAFLSAPLLFFGWLTYMVSKLR